MWLLNTAFVPFVEILNKKFAQTAVLLPPERHILSYLFNYFPVPRVGRESNKKKSKKNSSVVPMPLSSSPHPHLRPNIDTCITQTVLSTFEVALYSHGSFPWIFYCIFVLIMLEISGSIVWIMQLGGTWNAQNGPLKASSPLKGLNKVLYGEVPPGGTTPYRFIYHFWQKRFLFSIPSIDKWYPFLLQIHCLLNTNKSQNWDAFLNFYRNASLNLLGLFTDKNNKFPNPFIYFN